MFNLDKFIADSVTCPEQFLSLSKDVEGRSARVACLWFDKLTINSELSLH